MPKKIYILVHILGSSFFLFLCFIASPDWPRIDRMLSNPNGVRDFVFQLEMVLFFYFNFYFLLPKLYYRQKYVSYFLCILLLFILFVPVTSALIEQFFSHGHPPELGFKRPPEGGKLHFTFMSVRFYTFLLVFILSFLIKILSHLREVKNEKLISELDLLKSQIDSHFFFNTLNLIYSLTIENSPKTPETVLRLSSMMRYVLNSKDTYVNLDKEISYIQDYIEMYTMRIDPKVNVRFSTITDVPDYVIAPMILIPYVENAFKHGVLEEGDSYIEIQISIIEDMLRLHINNTIGAKSDEFEKTQIGQINSKRRLELHYPGKHKLSIKETATHYDLTLELILTKE